MNSVGLELRDYLQNDFSEYLMSEYEKIRYSKNIINRTKPIDFYKSYIPLSIQHQNFRTRIQEPEEILGEFKNLIITGPAGIGKTTLLKHLFIKCLESNFKIPILISLRNYNVSSHNSLEEFIGNQIDPSVAGGKDKWYNIFKKGKFVFLLDGFEEVNLNLKQKIVLELENFVSRNSDSNFIITSRSGTDIEYLLQFYHFEVQPLNEIDIKNFIAKFSVNNEMSNSLYSNIYSQEDSHIFQLLRNPLFLSIYILQFESNPHVPSKMSSFYRSIFDYLYSQHDSISKIGFIREKLSGLSKDDIEEVLKIFAFLTLSQGKLGFSKDEALNYFNTIKSRRKNLDFENEKLLYDFVVSLCIFQEEGLIYSFIHFSLVEYFTVLFIRDSNDENKKKLYINFSSQNYFANNPLSENFWKLAQELDTFGFSKYFVLRRLEIMLERAKENRSFMHLIGVNLNMKLEENKFLSFDTIDMFVLKMLKIVNNDFIEELYKLYENSYKRQIPDIETNNIVIRKIMDQKELIKKNITNFSDDFIDLIDWK